MIDFRLYRVALIPAVAAFVMMMFSLEGVPEPPDPQIAPAIFDSDRMRDNLRQVLDAAPERSPGSSGDEAVANLVLDRFDAVAAGTAATQSFEATVSGEDRQLRNVILTLPGESDRTLLVTAARDSASGPGAASSAAATAALIELAEALGGTEHLKTLVLVSTTAGTQGAEGALRFLEGYRERDLVEAAVVLVQPGAAEPQPPHVLRHSTDDRSTSMQLVRIAEKALAERTSREPAERGLFSSLARLALPLAAGEQSVLIEQGIDAVGISSAGERPLPPSEDTEEGLDRNVLAEFGAAALGTILILDPLRAPLEHGPDSYVEFSGSLVPGWAVAVFSLALLLPVAVAAFDGVARAARRRAGIVRALAWAFGLALPLVGVLAAIHLLGLIGLLATPAFPFDPGRFSVGIGEALVLALLAGLGVAGFLLGGLARAPERPWPEALVPALGSAAVAGALGVWLLNPYLALLLAPAAHLWLLAAREAPRPRPLMAAGVAVAILPALLATRSSAAAIGAGPWDLLLATAGGQVSAPILLALCPLAGSLAGLLFLMRAPRLERTDDRGAREGT